MRLALPALLLAASLTSAAPVPKDEAAERKKLEAAWDALWSPDEVARTRAVFALLDHPKAADFLADKLPPIDATKEQLRAWVKDLNDPDEKVWKAAFEKLQYFDPRTGLTPGEQIDLVHTNNGRRLLASLWLGHLIQFHPGTTHTSITAQRNGNGRWFVFNEERRDGGSGTGIDCAPASEIATPTWRRAAMAAHILRRIDTKPSRAALDRLASGHADALPTRTAVGLLGAKTPEPLTEKAFGKTWADFLGGDQLSTTAGAFALLDSPGTVKRLKAELPAVQATKAQITKWVKALDSEDEKEWGPAFEKLQLFRPLLGLSWEEQCEAVTTDHGRSRVFRLAGDAVNPPGPGETYADSTLTPRGENGLTIAYTHGGAGRMSGWTEPGTLATLNPPHWRRARIAVILLERMKSVEATAVLTQLADGHPDILHTKEAKAALERLK